MQAGGSSQTHGTTHVVFEPLAFIERLAALVPRPRKQLLTYHGVLAPAASWRDDIVPRSEEDEETGEEAAPRPHCSPKARRSWAELMQRSFGINVLLCPHCGGRRRLVALIQDPEVIRRILTHLALETETTFIAPARSPPDGEMPF